MLYIYDLLRIVYKFTKNCSHVVPVLEHTVIQGFQSVVVLLRQKGLDLGFIPNDNSKFNQKAFENLDIRAVLTSQVDHRVTILF